MKADADFQRAGAGAGEDAVVESAAAAEAPAAGIKGKTGADEGIDFVKRDFDRTGRGFEDIEWAGEMVTADVEGEFGTADFRIDPSKLGMGEDNRRCVNLAGEREVNGDCAEFGMSMKPLFQSGASWSRIERMLGKQLPHEFAELGLSWR